MSGNGGFFEKDPLLISESNGILTITINRPAKKNALHLEMYKEITNIFRRCNEDESVKLVVMTGVGDYFCSGNDLSQFMQLEGSDDPLSKAKAGCAVIKDYVAAYIDLTKPIVAIVNGPAIGIAVTTLTLFDMVFASDKATFVAPFTTLGQSAEGCSSYLFPKIMGYSRTGALLLFGEKIGAQTAKDWGLVTEVFSHENLEKEAWKRINEMVKLPTKSVIFSRELIRGEERAALHEANRKEIERLEERVVSDDAINAVMNFLYRRAKL